jgi:hypothetical protein
MMLLRRSPTINIKTRGAKTIGSTHNSINCQLLIWVARSGAGNNMVKTGSFNNFNFSVVNIQEEMLESRRSQPFLRKGTRFVVRQSSPEPRHLDRTDAVTSDDDEMTKHPVLSLC